MSVLRNLESKLAGLVEGTFSRAFKSEVRPVEIARKLAREMERAHGRSRCRAPTRRTSTPSGSRPRTASSSRATRTSCARAVGLPARARPPRADRAADAARRSSSRPTSALRLGEFGIQARLVRRAEEADAEAPSQGDQGHTMVYSIVRAGSAEPLREPDPRRARARGCASTAGPSVLGSRRRGARPLARGRRRGRRPQRLAPATPRCGRRAARGSCATSAPPTASRSTAAAIHGAQSLKPAT